jgi:hypothetical protein
MGASVIKREGVADFQPSAVKDGPGGSLVGAPAGPAAGGPAGVHRGVDRGRVRAVTPDGVTSTSAAGPVPALIIVSASVLPSRYPWSQFCQALRRHSGQAFTKAAETTIKAPVLMGDPPGP